MTVVRIPTKTLSVTVKSTDPFDAVYLFSVNELDMPYVTHPSTTFYAYVNGHLVALSATINREYGFFEAPYKITARVDRELDYVKFSEPATLFVKTLLMVKD